MERSDFLKLVASKLYPVLRADGFRGSGTTLRRVAGPVIHVVNIQGSSTATDCYLNLGAHLSFLPTDGGGTCVPARIKEYECSFRTRILPPDGGIGGRWAYGATQAESEALIEGMVAAWRKGGVAFFARFANYPDDFCRLVKNAILEPPHPGRSLAYARIGVQVGLLDEARTIAERALADVSPAATGLRANLLRFLETPRAGSPTRG